MILIDVLSYGRRSSLLAFPFLVIPPHQCSSFLSPVVEGLISTHHDRAQASQVHVSAFRGREERLSIEDPPGTWRRACRTYFTSTSSRFRLQRYNNILRYLALSLELCFIASEKVPLDPRHLRLYPARQSQSALNIALVRQAAKQRQFNAQPAKLR